MNESGNKNEENKELSDPRRKEREGRKEDERKRKD